MTQFKEPNTMNLKVGESVHVLLPHPDSVTFEEILQKYSIIGRVLELKHSAGGALQVKVEGLERIAGSEWTYPMYCERCAPVLIQHPEPAPLARVIAPVFAEGDNYIVTNIFQIKAARERYSVKWFFGEVLPFPHGRYRVVNFDNNHEYEVKVEEIARHEYRLSCACDDFHHVGRVCKHIYEVFDQEKRSALEKAA